MKLTDMFPSTLLKAQDITDAGGELELTIFSIEVREFNNDGGKERKPVISFQEGRQMVCNKTNANILTEMFGDNTDNMINKKITLVVQEVPFSGKPTPAIRIKNLNSREALITSYWMKAREIGLSREEGLAHLKEFGGDFSKALESLG